YTDRQYPFSFAETCAPSLGSPRPANLHREPAAMPITAANQVVARPVSWLWQDRIPLGKLVLLEGDPDLGKSLIALDLCARLSTGRPFADGQGGGEPANALVLSGEDAAADTIVPRLRRLGADLQRVFVWQRHEEPEDW